MGDNEYDWLEWKIDTPSSDSNGGEVGDVRKISVTEVTQLNSVLSDAKRHAVQYRRITKQGRSEPLLIEEEQALVEYHNLRQNSINTLKQDVEEYDGDRFAEFYMERLRTIQRVLEEAINRYEQLKSREDVELRNTLNDYNKAIATLRERAKDKAVNIPWELEFRLLQPKGKIDMKAGYVTNAVGEKINTAICFICKMEIQTWAKGEGVPRYTCLNFEANHCISCHSIYVTAYNRCMREDEKRKINEMYLPALKDVINPAIWIKDNEIITFKRMKVVHQSAHLSSILHHSVLHFAHRPAIGIEVTGFNVSSPFATSTSTYDRNVKKGSDMIDELITRCPQMFVDSSNQLCVESMMSVNNNNNNSSSINDGNDGEDNETQHKGEIIWLTYHGMYYFIFIVATIINEEIERTRRHLNGDDDDDDEEGREKFKSSVVVMIKLENRVEWLISELAAMIIGVVVVTNTSHIDDSSMCIFITDHRIQNGDNDDPKWRGGIKEEQIISIGLIGGGDIHRMYAKNGRRVWNFSDAVISMIHSRYPYSSYYSTLSQSKHVIFPSSHHDDQKQNGDNDDDDDDGDDDGGGEEENGNGGEFEVMAALFQYFGIKKDGNGWMGREEETKKRRGGDDVYCKNHKTGEEITHHQILQSLTPNFELPCGLCCSEHLSMLAIKIAIWDIFTHGGRIIFRSTTRLIDDWGNDLPFMNEHITPPYPDPLLSQLISSFYHRVLSLRPPPSLHEVNCATTKETHPGFYQWKQIEIIPPNHSEEEILQTIMMHTTPHELGTNIPSGKHYLPTCLHPTIIIARHCLNGWQFQGHSNCLTSALSSAITALFLKSRGDGLIIQPQDVECAIKYRCELTMMSAIRFLRTSFPNVDFSPFTQKLKKLFEEENTLKGIDAATSPMSVPTFRDMIFNDVTNEITSCFDHLPSIFSYKFINTILRYLRIRRLNVTTGDEDFTSLIEDMQFGLSVYHLDWKNYTWEIILRLLSRDDVVLLIETPHHLVLIYGATVDENGRRHLLIGRPAGGQSPCGYIPFNENDINEEENEELWRDYLPNEPPTQTKGIMIYRRRITAIFRSEVTTNYVWKPPSWLPPEFRESCTESLLRDELLQEEWFGCSEQLCKGCLFGLLDRRQTLLPPTHS